MTMTTTTTNTTLDHETLEMIETVLAEKDGWKIREDKVGRRGGRYVTATRYGDDGIARCICEISEKVVGTYDEDNDCWYWKPSAEWERPHFQALFAPGIIL